MIEWLEWARGPVFRFALVVMILGLARRVALEAFGIGKAVWVAGDKKLPIKKVLVESMAWINRFKKINDRPVYIVASTTFHIGFIAVGVFFASHVVLWRRGIGLGWPAFGQGAGDVLTIATIMTILVLLAARAVDRKARDISRCQDYVMLILMTVPMITGFLAAHPAINPIPYDATMFLHVMSGNLIMVLLPFSKLSHCVLLPSSRLVSEVAWHFPPDAGERVAAALGKDDSIV